MTIMRKTFTANPPKPASPVRPADTKRTFDARPKPSDDRRREDPRLRPERHIDQMFDKPDADTTSED
jgi:hypothetical protein